MSHNCLTPLIILGFGMISMYLIPFTKAVDCKGCLNARAKELVWDNKKNVQDCHGCKPDRNNKTDKYNNGRFMFCQKCQTCDNGKIVEPCTVKQDTKCEANAADKEKNNGDDKREDADPCEYFNDDELKWIIITGGSAKSLLSALDKLNLKSAEDLLEFLQNCTERLSELGNCKRTMEEKKRELWNCSNQREQEKNLTLETQNKQKKEIDRLNETQNKQNKEIESLNKDLREASETQNKQKKEIDRLNETQNKQKKEIDRLNGIAKGLGVAFGIALFAALLLLLCVFCWYKKSAYFCLRGGEPSDGGNTGDGHGNRQSNHEDSESNVNRQILSTVFSTLSNTTSSPGAAGQNNSRGRPDENPPPTGSRGLGENNPVTNGNNLEGIHLVELGHKANAPDSDLVENDCDETPSDTDESDVEANSPDLDEIHRDKNVINTGEVRRRKGLYKPTIDTSYTEFRLQGPIPGTVEVK